MSLNCSDCGFQGRLYRLYGYDPYTLKCLRCLSHLEFIPQCHQGSHYSRPYGWVPALFKCIINFQPVFYGHHAGDEVFHTWLELPDNLLY